MKKRERKRVQFHPRPGRGKGANQAFKSECDINRIIGRYAHWSDIPQTTKLGRDTTQDLEPQERCILAARQNLEFDNLPKRIKSKFQNNNAMLSWLADDKNRDQAIKLGLIAPQTPTTPSPASSAPTPASAPQNQPAATTGAQT